MRSAKLDNSSDSTANGEELYSIPLNFEKLNERCEKRKWAQDGKRIKEQNEKYIIWNKEKKLNEAFFQFHRTNFVLNGIPNYLIPVIYTQVRTGDKLLPKMGREERRDTSFMLLFGCRYYEDVFSHMKNIIFIKSQANRKFFFKSNRDIKGELTEEQTKSICESYKTDASGVKDKVTRISEIIFDTFKTATGVIYLEYKNKIHFLILTNLRQSKGNNRYTLLDYFSFNCDDKADIKEVPQICENILDDFFLTFEEEEQTFSIEDL